jgi:hypothetical protein
MIQNFLGHCNLHIGITSKIDRFNLVNIFTEVKYELLKVTDTRVGSTFQQRLD